MSKLLSRATRVRHCLVQVVSAGALAATGDVACQLTVEKSSVHLLDTQRSIRFGLVVACVTAPIQYCWFRFLDLHVRAQTKLVAGLKRVLFDQAIAAPILTSTFIFCVQLLNGHSVDGAAGRTRRAFVPVMATNYAVWPAVQLVNMTVIPFQYRVAFVQFVAIFWNVFLSSKMTSPTTD